MGEFADEYSEEIESELRDERHEIDVEALLNDTITTLMPAEPVCCRESTTVQEAVERMLARRHAGVLVVDGDGRLSGIFTERDVLTRVVGRDLDPRRAELGAVMTPDPEALSLRDRVAYAIHSMSVAGYRTIPLVDDARRPVGVVTVSDLIRWLANLFPEAILNLPPSDTLKRPGQIDSG